MSYNNELDKKIASTLNEVAESITPSKDFKERVDKAILQCCPDMKKKIAVIFGGCSPEYGVSLQSAYAVISHIDRDKYTPVLIGITKQGAWYCFDGDIEKIPADTWDTPVDCVPVVVSPNRSEHALLKITDNAIEKIHIAAAFPVLHGKNGEDGTVQGVFELAGIPVVGCGVLSSALCMDKDRAHKLVHAAGITVPHSYVLEKCLRSRCGVDLKGTKPIRYQVLLRCCCFRGNRTTEKWCKRRYFSFGLYPPGTIFNAAKIPTDASRH